MNNKYRFQELILESFYKLKIRFLLSETEEPIFKLIEKLVEQKHRHKLFFLDLDYNRSSKELIDYFGSGFEYYSIKYELDKVTYSMIWTIINMYDIIKIDNNKSLLSLQITKRNTDLSKQFSKLLDYNAVCHTLINDSRHVDKFHRFLNDYGNKIKNLTPTHQLIDAMNEYEFNKFVDKTKFDDYEIYHLAREKFGKENDDWINSKFEMSYHAFRVITFTYNKQLKLIYDAYVSMRFEIVDEILANDSILRYDYNLELDENIMRTWLLIKMTGDTNVKRVLVEDGLLVNANDDYIIKMHNTMEQLEVVDDFISFNSSLKDEFYRHKLLVN